MVSCPRQEHQAEDVWSKAASFMVARRQSWGTVSEQRGPRSIHSVQGRTSVVHLDPPEACSTSPLDSYPSQTSWHNQINGHNILLCFHLFYLRAALHGCFQTYSKCQHSYPVLWDRCQARSELLAHKFCNRFSIVDLITETASRWPMGGLHRQYGNTA